MRAHDDSGATARRSLMLLVAAATLVALAACSSGGSSSSGSTASPAGTATLKPGDAQPYTPPPNPTGISPAYVWCTALAKTIGGGVEADGVQALVLSSLVGQDAKTAADVWSKPDTELSRCALGQPISQSTPKPTTAPQCPSGKATVTEFPPTVTYLVDKSGKHVKIGSGGAYQPDPAIRCVE